MCEAVCGESFCVRCSDCIACSYDDECYDGQPHVYPTPDALAEKREQIALMFAVLEARRCPHPRYATERTDAPVRYLLPASSTGPLLRGGPFDGKRAWFPTSAIRPDRTIVLPVPAKNAIGPEPGLPRASDRLRVARYRLHSHGDLIYDGDS